MESFLKVVLMILLVCVMVIVLTPLYVFFGWIAGHIISWFCGDFVASGLNVLFGTTRFTKELLPIIGGALGFVGAFFKSTSSSS